MKKVILKKITYTLMCLSLLNCQNSEELSKTKTVFGKSKISLISESEILPHKSLAAVGNLLLVFLPTDVDQEKFYASNCTAIQISDQFILTAKHCIRSEMVFNKDQIAREEDLNLIDYNVYGNNIRLGFDGELIDRANDALNQELLKDPEYVDNELDFAIYQLPAKNKSKYVNIFQHPSKNKNFSNLTLYGHPNGVPFSKSTDCIGTKKDDYFYHTCDSLSGASGGLIIDTKTDKPIALHVAAASTGGGLYYTEHGLFKSPELIAVENGCVQDRKDFASCVIAKGRNKAILLTTIADRIKEHAPELHKKLTGYTSKSK